MITNNDEMMNDDEPIVIVVYSLHIVAIVG